MSIQLENVSFSYPTRKALDNVSLTVEPGRFTGLLGPNGAGKSTLFALITRMYGLQSGEIFINQQSIRQQPRSVMRSIGVVFQQSTLDLDLSVEQNLQYHAALHGIQPSRANESIERELARIDMLDRRLDKVRTLNGGHRRRLEIARALIHQPNVLLLDEATVGLDPQTRLDLNAHVRQLCQETGLTVLWATHLIDEIQPHDPVFILHQGHIEAAGTSTEIIERSGETTLQHAFKNLTQKRASA